MGVAQEAVMGSGTGCGEGSGTGSGVKGGEQEVKGEDSRRNEGDEGTTMEGGG